MIIEIISILALIYIVVVNNLFISLKHRVEEAFSTMDVYLKKRWDLLPNLVETVKGYSKYENSLLQEIIDSRKKNYEEMSYEEKIAVGEKLTKPLSKLIALKENYPELMADKNYRNLSENLVKIEEDIANARKYYNGTVRLYNDKVQMFPSNLIAKLFNYRSYQMFEVPDSEKENVEIEV